MTLKTHTELGITLKQYNALVQVFGKLARGELRHRASWRGSTNKVYALFDMSTWCIHGTCGTVGCLGGWATHVANDPSLFKDLRGMNNLTPALKSLFYPYSVPEEKWGKLTPQQAGAALCHYLQTGADGSECWNKALGK